MTGFFPAPGVHPPSMEEIVAAVVAHLQGDAPAVLRVHQSSDVDGSPLAGHHTLGLDGNQAAAGNHLHTAYSPVGHTHDIGDLTGDATDLAGHMRSWYASSTAAQSPATIVAATAESKDTIGDLAFTVVLGRRYTIAYRARAFISSGAAPTSIDARLRYTTGSPPASPSNASTQWTGLSVSIGDTPGVGATSFYCSESMECPDDIAAGSYLVAAFDRVTSGTGTITVDAASGARRSLEVWESIPG